MVKPVNFFIKILPFLVTSILTPFCRKEKVLLPEVTTVTASNITQISAITGGKVTKDGGAEISVRGICWSTSVNPAITGNKTEDGTGTGNFSSKLGNLTPNTLYYVKAYASNQAGTGYGNEVSFKTKQIEPAVLTTANISSISQTTAISGGNITDDNGGLISSRGVCWATKSNPTINDFRTSDGTGIGSFVKADTSRILFDYADILCYDDDGKQTTSSWNGHTFPSITSSNLGDASIGHIGTTGAIRLAKAQWWLLARIAGWNGN